MAFGRRAGWCGPAEDDPRSFQHFDEVGSTIFLTDDREGRLLPLRSHVQLLFKLVRGFDRDMQDANDFIRSGMVDPDSFRPLVQDIPDRTLTKYPTLTRRAVVGAVMDFLDQI